MKDRFDVIVMESSHLGNTEVTALCLAALRKFYPEDTTAEEEMLKHIDKLSAAERVKQMAKRVVWSAPHTNANDVVTNAILHRGAIISPLPVVCEGTPCDRRCEHYAAWIPN